MPSIAGARALYSAQAAFRATSTELYQGASDRIAGLLARSADGAGVIPTSRETVVVRDAGEIVLRLFVGADGRSAYAADGVTALAPFPQALNQAVADVTAAVVRAHARWLARNAPEDVVAWLAAAPRRPVRELVTARLDASDVFRPDPLAVYDRLHRWVDPNGYRLSDRVWQSGMKTRMRVDALVADGIRSGRGALVIARQSEQFLLPNRAALRTKKPYGSDASFDGMRLARTEISAAHGRATLAAAAANPYVSAIDWRVSASHPDADPCDANAAAGPYPLDRVPPYPQHPMCLCVLVPVVTASPADVTAQLRALMDAGEAPPYTTPADETGFLLELLGPVLLALVGRGS